MAARVTVSIEEHVAMVALARPDKRNALDPQMFEQLAEAGEAIKRDGRMRAVVLYGEGDHFCAGIDLASLSGILSDNAEFRRRALALADGEIANEFQKASRVWQEIEVPVIAALRGVAFGGGCQIALGADIRIAAPDARLSIMEIKWGLVPDMGLMTTLPKLVRIDIAKELALTGRIVEAEEALRLGLITRMDPDPVSAALDMARQVAARSPDAVRGSKALLQGAWNDSAAGALRLEAEIQAGIIGMPNQTEAVAANLEGRTPRFQSATLARSPSN